MKQILITALLLCTMYSYGQINQDIYKLLDTLKSRGYVINKDDVKDIKDLERYLALDTKLKKKQKSVDSIFISMNDHYRYLDKSTESTDLRNRIQSYGNMSKQIKARYIKKNELYTDDKNYLTRLLNSFDYDIDRSYNSSSFLADIETNVDQLKSIKKYYILDSIRVNKEKSELASLPTKAVINTKFRTYTHKTGHVFERFPSGFTPKPGKAVTERVFGRKARYREVDANGMNTLVIEFYDSGNIMNATVYGGKGSNMIYYAQYRDHTTKPYEVRTHSADGKFYVVHKRIYDMYDNKTTVTTKYQYVPMDYWYD